MPNIRASFQWSTDFSTVRHGEGPNAAAWKLFERIATPSEVAEVIEYSCVLVHGKWNCDYIVRWDGSTYVINDKFDCLARGCLIIDTGSIPVFDHMIANYLVLKNNEAFYWQTAVISREMDFESPLRAMRQAGLQVEFRMPF